MMKEIAEHIGTNFSCAADMHWSIKGEKKVATVEPPEPIAGASGSRTTATQKLIWEKRAAKFVKWEAKLDKSCQKACSLVCGQCAKHVHLKLEGHKDHEQMKMDCDIFKLIKAMKKVDTQV